MNCDKAQELFSELHEETLNEGLGIKVSGHLQDCPSCQHEFSAFQRNYSLFASLSPVAVPDDLDELIARKLDRIDFEKKKTAPTASGRWLKLASIGAAAAAVIAVAVFWEPATNGVQANVGGIPTTKPSDMRVEKVSGVVRLRYSAKADTRIDVLEGGIDHFALPPIDAKQVRVDQVRAGSHYDVPIDVKGPLPRPLWLRVSTSSEIVGVFFPQPGALTAREFEGNSVNALQAIANGYGVVVEAHLTTAGKSRMHSLQGEDPVAASKKSMKGTPHTDISLTNGVLRVR